MYLIELNQLQKVFVGLTKKQFHEKNYKIALEKLHYHGIRGYSTSLIKTY